MVDGLSEVAIPNLVDVSDYLGRGCLNAKQAEYAVKKSILIAGLEGDHHYKQKLSRYLIRQVAVHMAWEVSICILLKSQTSNFQESDQMAL